MCVVWCVYLLRIECVLVLHLKRVSKPINIIRQEPPPSLVRSLFDLTHHIAFQQCLGFTSYLCIETEEEDVGEGLILGHANNSNYQSDDLVQFN